jgi:hypothetical protein
LRGDTNISDFRPGITLIDETYLLKVDRACLFLYRYSEIIGRGIRMGVVCN